ncbi:MAG: hypothetical protein GQ553_00425 [Nitrosomonadaceae bacterium]|nr:hypothetical protein [Nitrosomonadaceae bacterium]
MKTDENFLVKNEHENWVLYGPSFFIKQFTPNLRRVAKKFTTVNLELFYESLYIHWPWAKGRTIDLEVEWTMGCWHIYVEGRKILIFDPEKRPWKKSRSSTQRSSSQGSKTKSRKAVKKESVPRGSSSPSQHVKKQSGTPNTSKKQLKEVREGERVRYSKPPLGKAKNKDNMPHSQPTKTPKLLGSCPHHPKYSALRLPRRTKKFPDGCPACVLIYSQVNPESKRKYIRNDLKSLE